MNNLSDYDRMKNERLPNWGRWGRQNPDRPDPEAGSGAIYSMGRADRDGDGEEAPEPIVRIDHRDAEWLDKLIANKVGQLHRHVVCNYYYRRKEQFRHKVPEAVRALLDAEYVALELGWRANG